MTASVVTRSRLCPPASSWPRTRGCHIPGFIRWTCTPMVREAAVHCRAWGRGAGGSSSPGSSVPSPSPAAATYDGKHHQPCQKAPGVNMDFGSQCSRISSDVHGLLHASICPLLHANSHVAAFACTKGCPGGWPWLPRPDPDPAGSQAWEKPLLPGWGQRVPPRARGDGREEPEAGAVWSAFCNDTGKFISVSQW